MKPEYIKATICKNEEIAPNIFSLWVETNQSEKDILPGQFYMLKADHIEPLLPRPISVCSVESGKIEFLYEAVGRGTKIFSTLSKGDKVNIMGPLGNGFPIEEAKGKVAIVSGGIGIAPMKELVKRLKAMEEVKKIHIYAGFRDKSYLIEELKGLSEEINIATDSGKEGYKGFVTEIIDYSNYDLVFCCGPEPMMLKVVNQCRAQGVKVYVSMEKHMACGVGACLVCTCKTKEGNKRTCKDGPVFLGETLVV